MHRGNARNSGKRSGTELLHLQRLQIPLQA
nr:MAG TPA: hypothetical protein [Caudoviricetes sp.]